MSKNTNKISAAAAVLLALALILPTLPVNAAESLEPDTPAEYIYSPADPSYLDRELAAENRYNGEGMCIAVIGAGFSTSHESFFLTSEDSAKLTKEYVDSVKLNAECEDSLFVSSKIPFAYDYAGKSADVSGLSPLGTPILSAAAGNSSSPEHSPGAAPEAQVLLMKVVSDNTLRAGEADIIAAIEDAVTLGADIIYLSIGEPCGFYDVSGSGLSINSAIEAAEAAGAIVIASAGNTRKIGTVSPYYTDAAILAPTTDRPDTGTVSYPASSGAIAVGSAETNIQTADCLIIDGERLPYSDTNTLWESPTGGVSFKRFFGEKTLAYEFVPGLGYEQDFAGIDLTGKLAVITRGDITFNEKCKNAAANGAIGVIVVDSEPDPSTALDVKMDISESPIPAILISSASADKLRGSESREVSVSMTEFYCEEFSPTPTPSQTSASGVTPELSLKPDLTVVGENVVCAAAESGYITTGGPSIAAARAAGMLARISQKLRAEGYSKNDSAARAMNLLASSAVPMTEYDGTILSPRIQGSGAASLSRALDAELMLTSDGGHKIELGQINKSWFSFNVTVENLTDSPKRCSIDAIVGSDGYKSFLYSEIDASNEKRLAEKLGKQPDDSVNFIDSFSPFEKTRIFPGDESMNLNAYAENGAPFEFTLKAKSSLTFHLTVMLDQALLKEYKSIFTNGFFAEGYVRVGEIIGESIENTASIPFVGFVGDWYKSGAFDTELYGKTSPLADSIYLYRVYGGNQPVMDGSRLVLGSDPFRYSQAVPAKELICFSTAADAKNSKIYLNLGLLRSVTDVKVRVFDYSGRLVHEYERGSVSKTYLDYATNMIVSEQLEIWDGRADGNRYYIYPDGEYRVEITARTVGSPKESKLTYPLVLDSQPPVLDSHEIAFDGEFPFLSFEASDKFALALKSVYDENSIDAKQNEDGSYDLSNLGRYIYIELTDLALNSSVYRFENPMYDD